jgi:preprotein translocase subunit YajC
MSMDAFAQAAGAAAPQNPMIGTLLMLLQFVPIFLIIYLLILRPQQQRQKQAEKMLKELKKGDRVLTSGGIYGTVIGIDDVKAVLKIADDIKVEFAKSAIVQVVPTEARG